MTKHKSTFDKPFITKNIRISTVAALLIPFAVGGIIAPSQARSRQPVEPRTAPISGFNTIEAWQGQRPLLLLPVKYGSDFNLNKDEFSAVHTYAEQAVRRGLTDTGKLAVFRPGKHAPTLMRAVQDEKITQDQMDTLVKSPTVQNADAVLSLMEFDAAPLIAEFTLGKVTSYTLPTRRGKVDEDAPQPTAVQVEVTGNLYEVGHTDKPIKTITTTSELDPVIQQDYRPEDRVLLAISDATDQIARQFVLPSDPLSLPEPTGVVGQEQEAQKSQPKRKPRVRRSTSGSADGSGVTRPRDVEFTTNILTDKK